MDRMKLNRYAETESRIGGLNRRYDRGEVAGFSCDIADGHRLIAGSVDNVSTNGFKMSCAGDTFKAGKYYYQAVLSGNGRHYKIVAKPCWMRKTDNGLEVGFKIIDVSWEWTELVLETVSQGDRYASLQGNA